jgi:hypothetical protein
MVNASLSRASEFGCDFGWPRARGGCLGGLAPIPGVNGLSAKSAYPLHGATSLPALAEFTFPGQPHLKFKDKTSPGERVPSRAIDCLKFRG